MFYNLYFEGGLLISVFCGTLLRTPAPILSRDCILCILISRSVTVSIYALLTSHLCQLTTYRRIPKVMTPRKWRPPESNVKFVTLLKFAPPPKVAALSNVVLLCFKHMFIQQKVMFVFKVNNQLKGTYTCLLRKYVFIVNFPIFTTCSLILYVATIAADNHVKLIIAAAVKHYVLYIIRLTDGVLRNALNIYLVIPFSWRRKCNAIFQIIKPLFSSGLVWARRTSQKARKTTPYTHGLKMTFCFCFIVYSGQNVRSFISILTISVIKWAWSKELVPTNVIRKH